MTTRSWTEKMEDNAMNRTDHHRDGNRPTGPCRSALDTADSSHPNADDAWTIHETIVSTRAVLRIAHDLHSNCS